MVAVLDASVLAKLFLPEPLSDAAERVARDHRLIVAPDLARLEVASAITRAARTGTVTTAYARGRLAAWRGFADLGNVRMVASADLQPAAEELSLALRHPLADCLYLALAEGRQLPLITADRPFVDKAGDRFTSVRHLDAAAA